MRDPIDNLLADIQSDLFWVSAAVRRLSHPEVFAIQSDDGVHLTNAVLRTTCKDSEIPRIIREIQDFHTVSSRWMVLPPFNPTALKTHLPRAGYAPTFQGDGFSIDTNRRWSTGAFRTIQVHDSLTLHDHLHAFSQGFGIPNHGIDPDRELRLCTQPNARTARFVTYSPDGEPIASGGINRYPEARFGLLWAGCTVPSWRGRGAYRALLSARSNWARRNGLTRIGLYASRATSGPIVDRLGFQKHGPMALWDRED